MNVGGPAIFAATGVRSAQMWNRETQNLSHIQASKQAGIAGFAILHELW